MSLLLSTLLGLALVLMIAPNVIAMNRGKTLQNIALWLAILLAVGLAYQNFGPGKNAVSAVSSVRSSDKHDDSPEESQPAPIDDQNYTPPRE